MTNLKLEEIVNYQERVLEFLKRELEKAELKKPEFMMTDAEKAINEELSFDSEQDKKLEEGIIDEGEPIK